MATLPRKVSTSQRSMATALSTERAADSTVSAELRVAVAGSCRGILDEAARACGSHPFAVAHPLDRARRDLELFLLQHRLEPALVRAGRTAIEEHRSRP